MHNVVRFLLPNELVQQHAGQRQDIQSTENKRTDLFPARDFA